LLALLIIGVVGGTAVFVVRRLQNTQETPSGNQTGSLTEAPTGGQNVVDPTGDDDVDQLSNSDEALWGTDRKNPDTDNDGYLDGEEVRANYNPTIPSPNDKLPEGFLPGKDLAPLPPAESEPVAVDQFFQDNLDLTLGTKNYAEAYQQQYDVANRNPTTLSAFVKEQPVVTQLPRPEEKSIQRQADDSAASIAAYLSRVGNVSVFSNRPLFTTAVNDLFGRRDPSTIQGVGVMMKIYQDELVQTPVPPSAVALHQLLLGYTQTMQVSLEQMGRYNEDSVRALVAMKQWQENDSKYVPLIEQEVSRLEALSQ
jgi:hypothetical protein